MEAGAGFEGHPGQGDCRHSECGEQKDGDWQGLI